MKRIFCFLALIHVTYINCQSLSHMPDQINLKRGKHDQRTHSNLGLGPTFSMKDIISNRGSNVYFPSTNNKSKTSDSQRQEQMTSYSQQFLGAQGQGVRQKLQQAPAATFVGFKHKAKEVASPPVAPAPSKPEPSPETSGVAPIVNNPLPAPVQKAAPAAAPSPSQPETAVNAQPMVPAAPNNNGQAANSAATSGAGTLAKADFSQWFGNNVPEQFSQMTPEQMYMMSEQSAAAMLAQGLLGAAAFGQNLPPPQPAAAAANNLVANNPNAPTNPAVPSSANSWMSGNAMTAMDPLNQLKQMRNQMVQLRVNQKIAEAMNPREAGIDVNPLQKPIVCKGIVPPAPGNETVQQMLADGGKASMVAMTLGLELSVMEGAVLCHNKLAEFQACDITPSRLKRPCQPNIPNACPVGQVCNLYSGEFSAMCCPKTVREAVMLDMMA
ncbi:uncharacterized protein [Magallana gigas]|uniref:uncharacterized protein isoform X2 n=1 Tax=Magallana gigas TaxID=29159 RepID=UPI00333FE2B1